MNHKNKHYIPFHFLLIAFTLYSTLPFIYSLTYYSQCDSNGKCYLSLNSSWDIGQWTYLTPGMSLFGVNDDVTIIPINSSLPQSEYTLETISGFSKLGQLPNSDDYECAGGLNECVNSCCNAKGHCADTLNSCKSKKDKASLIYIITAAVYIAIIIAYWIIFFIFGCNYNKKALAEMELRDNQGYKKPMGIIPNVNPNLQNVEDVNNEIDDEHEESKASDIHEDDNEEEENQNKGNNINIAKIARDVQRNDEGYGNNNNNLIESGSRSEDKQSYIDKDNSASEDKNDDKE